MKLGMKKSLLVAMLAILPSVNAFAEALIFSDDFNGYSAYFGGYQNATNLPIYWLGNLPWWNKAGTNAVHGVSVSPNNYAPMLIGDNALMSKLYYPANTVGASYKVSFKAGPASYITLAEASDTSDGLVVQVIRIFDGSVLASSTVMVSDWASNATNGTKLPLRDYSFNYTGDGSGNGYVYFRISTLNSRAWRFGGMIDDFKVLGNW